MSMTEANGWSYSSQTVSHQDIDTYAEVTGDYNDIHFGPDRIAHGGLLVGRLSAAIWQRYGNGTKALSLTVGTIKRPIKPDEKFVVAIGSAQQLVNAPVPGSALVEFRITKTINEREKEVLTGSATIVPVKDSLLQQEAIAS